MDKSLNEDDLCLYRSMNEDELSLGAEMLAKLEHK